VNEKFPKRWFSTLAYNSIFNKKIIRFQRSDKTKEKDLESHKAASIWETKGR
jgi:hypothetical protein